MIAVSLSISSIAEEVDTIPQLEERIRQKTRLTDLVEYAVLVNSDIKAVKNEWEASLERQHVVIGYPDPQVSLTYLPDLPNDSPQPKKIEIMVSQRIPAPGMLSAAGKLNQSDSYLRQLDVNLKTRDLGIQIAESYYELFYLREAQKILAKNKELTIQLKASAEADYARNQQALTDVIRLRSQIHQIEYDIQRFKERENVESIRLNSLLNRSIQAPFGISEELSMVPIVFQLEELIDMAEIKTIELQMITVEIERSKTESEFARLENKPEYMLGIIFESSLVDAAEGERETMWGLQFGMTLPIWQDKKAGRVKSTDLLIEKNRHRFHNRLFEIKNTIKETFFVLKDAERLTILQRDQVIPEIKHSVETANLWYQQRMKTQMQALELQMLLQDSSLVLARAKADFFKALKKLEGIVGTSLTSKK